MPKISVILPVYNGEKYLKDSIESILHQTFSDFELILVDDCSTDKSGEIAQDYVQKDSRISYIKNKKNLKLPASLNKGFQKACGEYWTWTSCDNTYQPNAFSELVKSIEKNSNLGLVYSSMNIIDEHSRKTGQIIAGSPEDLIFRNVVGACFLYRKSIAKKVGEYNLKLFLCEDFQYWLRIASISLLNPIHKNLYNYRVHTESLTHTNQKKIIEKGISVQRTYYSAFVKTRKRAALFYAHLRAYDVYNPFRQFYLFVVLWYSPVIFLKELFGLVIRRFRK